jgi:hypothetical protein
MIRKLFIALIFATVYAFYTPAQADFSFYNEEWYAGPHCDSLGGTFQVKYDNKFVDCVTNDYVIEYELAYNWRIAIGHALAVASEKRKPARIVLIIRGPGDNDKVEDLQYVINHRS